MVNLISRRPNREDCGKAETSAAASKTIQRPQPHNAGIYLSVKAGFGLESLKVLRCSYHCPVLVLSMLGEFSEPSTEQIKVSEIMDVPSIFAGDDEELEIANTRMRENQLTSISVMSAEGKMVGVL